MGMVLTERDYNLLRWINQFGFVTRGQVSMWLGAGMITAYQRLRKLVDEQYLKYERVSSGAGVYFLSHRGIQVSKSKLPAVRRIFMGNYHHHLQIVSLSLCLVKRFSGQY